MREEEKREICKDYVLFMERACFYIALGLIGMDCGSQRETVIILDSREEGASRGVQGTWAGGLKGGVHGDRDKYRGEEPQSQLFHRSHASRKTWINLVPVIC